MVLWVPSPSIYTAVTNECGVLIIPLEVDNRKASRCFPSSKTVVAKIGLMVAVPAGSVVGGIIGVSVADELQPTAKIMLRVIRPDMN